MTRARTAFHLTCAALFETLGARHFEVIFDRPLATGLLRPDFILLRRHGPRTKGRILRRLWPLLSRFAVVEYKSPGYLVAADEVARAEKDELLGLISDDTIELRSDSAFRWFRAHVLQDPKRREMQRLEGYDNFLERALARLPAKTHLRRLKAK